MSEETTAPTFGEQDRAVTRCEATYGTSAHQCTGAAGHADDHTAYSAATGGLEWSDADNAAKLPQREPGAALGCSSVSPHGDACTLARDHGGMHETHWRGERMASWADDPDDIDRCNKRMGTTRGHRCERTAGHTGVHSFDGGPLNNEEALLRELFDGVPGSAHRLKVLPLNPQPVRVRFVELPTTYPGGVATPGGFALVVDRFKHLAHLEAEREMWTAWADLIGARTVLCYPGELDIVGWLDDV